MQVSNTELNSRKPFSGMRVLVALAIGLTLGLSLIHI